MKNIKQFIARIRATKVVDQAPTKPRRKLLKRKPKLALGIRRIDPNRPWFDQVRGGK